MGMRTYTELSKIQTFKDRFLYLKLDGRVSEETFGFDRYLNQKFYASSEWRRLRNRIIVRDEGCDMAIPDREIFGKIIIHHMNPISISDLVNVTDILLNPEYLICVSLDTHNAIHYGDENLLMLPPMERKANDTCPWKH